MRKSVWIFAAVACMQCAIAQQIEVTVNNTINNTFTSEGNVTLNDGSTDIIDDQGSGASASTSHNTQHTAYTNQDRVTDSGTDYKHHMWDANVNEFTLDYDFNTPSTGATRIVNADFTDIYDVYIFNNFEEFTDEGDVHFKDPWYVDASGDQTGDYEDFNSPHMPTGADGETSGGIFLGKDVRANQPYYSMEFQSFLDYDFETA